jgi:hypothetical protein
MAKSGSKVNRKPANFVPDDDLIVVPMVIERNFIEDFHHKHEARFKQARKKLNYWLSQEQYAQDYGLENTGIVNLPTNEDKEKFLHRNYLRFISKDVEKSTNSSINETINSWTTDDEIDSIAAIEEHEKVIVKARKNRGRKDLNTSKSVKVGGRKIKVGFQLRPEIGMAKFTVKSSLLDARAWLGVNGNQEVKLSRRFKSTGTSGFVNYYIDETRVLAAVDQRLVKNLSLRLSHSKYVEDFDRVYSSSLNENNILQLRFNVGF